MSEEEKKQVPDEILLGVIRGVYDSPCPKEYVQDAIQQAQKLLFWAHTSEDEIVQSFTITCRTPNTTEPDVSQEPKMMFIPMGQEITPDDCEVLACSGIQWCIGSRQAARARMKKLREAEEASKQSRIWTPGQRIPS